MIIGDKSVFNEAVSLYEKLSNEIHGNWNSIILCSAFLSDSAAESLIQLIDEIKNSRKLKFTIMIGIKNNFTSPNAIRTLIKYIEKSNKKNIKFDLRLPLNDDFHVKSYVFIGSTYSKAIVGSANLTDTGLKSKGELMVEINDKKMVDEIVAYLDSYSNDSEKWIDYIEEYSQTYEKHKLTITNPKITNLIKKRRKKKNNSRLTIRFTAPTIDTLSKGSKEQKDRVNNIFEIVKKKHEDLIKAHWVIYSDMSVEEIKSIKEKYSIGCCFDRPIGINENWNIGDDRAICYVGSIVDTLEDEIVMFMKKKKRCTHYKVTEEIIEAAEKYFIKNDDEEYIPSKVNMDAYKKFVLEHRKSKR